MLHDGRPRQLDAVAWDGEKSDLLNSHGLDGEERFQRAADGRVMYISVVGKLLTLAAVKFCTRDPGGIGISMEGGRPGWLDAMNGLPALFGSSTAEATQLLNLLDFLITRAFPEESPFTASSDRAMQIQLPVELGQLLEDVKLALDEYGQREGRRHSSDDSEDSAKEQAELCFRLWDHTSAALERSEY